MKQITLDGISYEAAPEVINALDKAKTHLDSVKVELKDIKKDNATLKGENDSLKEENKNLKNIDHAETIQKAVDERTSLIEIASKHLDEKEMKDISSKSSNDIKIEVVKKHSSDFKHDSEMENADVYLQARFDAVKDIDLNKTRNDKMADQRKKIKGQNSDSKSDEVSQDSSREKMISSMVNDWDK